MFTHIRGNLPSGGWWLLMGPGLGLILMALAIFIWPALLAYMVASVFFLVGMALVGWGWRLRSAERHVQRHLYMRTAHEW
jgi:uncharacterized membrane protein YqjE